jgi:uroporphyrinogen-III synthase
VRVTGTEKAEAVTGFEPHQLVGFRIGVTSDRRSGDLIAALERRGAEVLHAPTLRIVPAEEDARLIEDTRAVIAARPDVVLATTAYGVRGWLEAADAAGLGPALLQVLSDSRILVRGPKARGAIRAGGLTDSGMSAQETTESLVDQVVDEGVPATVVVQLHGFVDTEQLTRLRVAGAQVLTVAPYRWTTPIEPQRVGRILDAIAARSLDAVTFTSAPAAQALLVAARERGVYDEVVNALRTDVMPFSVGPVTAAPLHAAGIESVYPDRYRLGALVRFLCEYLTEHRIRRIVTRHGMLEIRGRNAVINGRQATLSPTSVAVLRTLADAGGAVVPRAKLQVLLPEAGDDHAVEVAVGRLRQALDQRGLVATVIKRGYRLDV